MMPPPPPPLLQSPKADAEKKPSSSPLNTPLPSQLRSQTLLPPTDPSHRFVPKLPVQKKKNKSLRVLTLRLRGETDLKLKPKHNRPWSRVATTLTVNIF